MSLKLTLRSGQQFFGGFMTGNSVVLRWALLSAIALRCANTSTAQTPLPSDVPTKFDAPNSNYDYVKATQRVYHSAAAPSFIDLPVVPAK
jgi:hypothetical protein